MTKLGTRLENVLGKFFPLPTRKMTKLGTRLKNSTPHEWNVKFIMYKCRWKLKAIFLLIPTSLGCLRTARNFTLWLFEGCCYRYSPNRRSRSDAPNPPCSLWFLFARYPFLQHSSLIKCNCLAACPFFGIIIWNVEEHFLLVLYWYYLLKCRRTFPACKCFS